jgi:hypothetical protein
MALTKLTMDSLREPGPDNTLMAKVNELINALTGVSSEDLTVNGDVIVYDTVGATVSLIGGTGITILDDTAQAAGVGGALILGGKYTDAGDYAGSVAAIKAAKSNGTTGNYSFDLLLATSVNGGSLTEHMRIYYDGGVLVGSQAGDKVGFYGTAPIAKQTGVAVNAAGIHAALVNLGLIAA